MRGALPLLALALASCSGTTQSDRDASAGMDAEVGPSDAARADGAGDTGVFADASEVGPTDAGAGDGTTADAADASGSGPSDAGAPDAGSADAGAFAPYGVLSLNLHCLKLDGTPYSTNADRFAAIAGLVQRENVRVVLAQEVCVRADVSAVDLMVSALEAATGATWSSHWVFVHDAWAGTPDYAREGVAVFARGELTGRDALRYRTQGALARAVAYADLPRELGGLRAHSVHLDVTSAGIRTGQGYETASYAVTAADPSLGLLVAGDFNDVSSSPACRAMIGAGFTEPSSPLDLYGIDHVFVHRGAPVSVTSARLAFDGSHEPHVSDHPGVLVGLAPGTPAAVAPTRFLATWSGANFLAVRGDTAPLTWTRGWPAWPTEQGTWRLTLTELPAASFAYKWVRDDSDSGWQLGDNLTGTGGSTLTATPQFP